MLSSVFLKTQFLTFSEARRRLYQLGLQPRNGSRTIWEDVDGLHYEIVNGDGTCTVVPM